MKPLIEPKDRWFAKNVAALIVIAGYSAVLLHLMN